MAAVSAIDDAKRFLDLHPWATTDVDNPVELLAAVVREVDDEYEYVGEDEMNSVVVHRDPDAVIEQLLTFIKGLRDDCKISENEYRFAKSIVE